VLYVHIGLLFISGADMKTEKIRVTVRKKIVKRRMMMRILPTQGMRLILEIALSPDLSVRLTSVERIAHDACNTVVSTACGIWTSFHATS